MKVRSEAIKSQVAPRPNEIHGPAGTLREDKMNILPDRSFPLPPSPFGVRLTGRGRACARPANTLEEIHMKVSVKVAGASGQISLGKEHAGRQVLTLLGVPLQSLLGAKISRGIAQFHRGNYCRRNRRNSGA